MRQVYYLLLASAILVPVWQAATGTIPKAQVRALMGIGDDPTPFPRVDTYSRD